MDDRVKELESQVSDLRVQHAEVATELRAMRPQIEELTRNVAKLTDTINKGRGALWFISGLCAALGAAGEWVTHSLHN